MNENEKLLRELMRAAASVRRKPPVCPEGKDAPDMPPHMPPPPKKRGYGHTLSAIAEEDGQSQQQLADRMKIRPQSLTEALSSLEERGLIERRQSGSDKRCMQVYLTQEGRQQNELLAQDRRRRADKAFGGLTEEDKAELSRLLALISDTEKEGENL